MYGIILTLKPIFNHLLIFALKIKKNDLFRGFQQVNIVSKCFLLSQFDYFKKYLVWLGSTAFVPFFSVMVTSMNLGMLRAKERAVTGMMYTRMRRVLLIVCNIMVTFETSVGKFVIM